MRAALVALVVVSACGGDAPVAPVRVAAVAVTAPETTLKIGAIVVATAKLTDVNGSVLTGRALSWNSADETVASVSSTGAIKAVGLGMTTINAVSEGVSGGIALVVVPPPVASVAVTVVDHTQPSAAVQAFVTLRDADGNVLTGRPVGWTSSAPLVAAVSSTGVVSGVGPGVATITATSEDVSGSASVSVPAVASVSLNASALTLLPKQTVRLAVTLLDAAAAPATNRIASWSSSAPNVASISDSGVVTALQIGTSSVTVTTEGKSATAIVNVVAPPVTNISLSLSDASLVPVAISSPARAGTAIRIFALLSDSAGGRLPGRRDITWSSSDSVVGAIVAADSQSAVLTIGYGPLPVTITASLDGRAASAVLGVPYTPGSITLSLAGAPAKIITGDTARLALSILTPPRISSAVVWTSSNRNAAMVDSTGKITAIGLGATSISARSVVDATAVASLDLMVRSVLTGWGDSLTEGGVGFGTDWLRVAANQLGGRVDRNRGVSGQTASQIVGRFFADTAPPHDVAIFWLGRNDMGDPGRVGEAAHPDTVKKYLAQAIAALSGDKRFLVLSVLNGDFPDEQSGQSRYAAIVLLNTDLAAKYPANFIDVRTMLVAAANAAMATDMANQAADVPPASLRFDELHLNDAGHALVGKAVAAFLATRDW